MRMMINCFCGMVDRRKAFSFISSRDHCQRSSPSQISDTPRAGFEPAQYLSSGLVEWNCAVVITTTPWRHKIGTSKFMSRILQAGYFNPFQANALFQYPLKSVNHFFLVLDSKELSIKFQLGFVYFFQLKKW